MTEPEPQALAFVLVACLLVLALCAAVASILVIAEFCAKEQGAVGVTTNPHRPERDLQALAPAKSKLRQSHPPPASQLPSCSMAGSSWAFLTPRQGLTAGKLRTRRLSLLSNASDSITRCSDEFREWGEPVVPAVVSSGLLGRIDQALSSGALRPQSANELLKLYGLDLDEMLHEEMAAAGISFAGGTDVAAAGGEAGGSGASSQLGRN